LWPEKPIRPALPSQMLKRVYLPLALFLLACQVILMFYYGVKLLLITEYEVSMGESRTFVQRFNFLQEFMMWFHAATIPMALIPPITSFLGAGVSAVIALINWNRYRAKRLLVNIDNIDRDIARAKRDAVIRVLLYLGAGGATVWVLIKTPRRPEILPQDIPLKW
jgi:hypothetical protein